MLVLRVYLFSILYLSTQAYIWHMVGSAGEFPPDTVIHQSNDQGVK